MNKNNRYYLFAGIATILILSVFILYFSFYESNNNQNSILAEDNSEILYQINQQAILYQKNNHQEKLAEQKILMQEKLKDVASKSLGLNVVSIELYDSFFPFVNGSEIKILEDKESFQTCNVVENIPDHLEKISHAKLFQMFAQKYSEYEIELSLQEERMYNGEFHYGFIAKSHDNTQSALTYFHANSCTNEIADIDNYFLSCHRGENYIFGTKNHEDIIASFEHEDFCIIPLDSWRQSFYDYHKRISHKVDEQIKILETENLENETVNAAQLEKYRLDLLSNIAGAIFSGTKDEKIIQEKILEYTNVFDKLPDDFQILLDTKHSK